MLAGRRLSFTLAIHVFRLQCVRDVHGLLEGGAWLQRPNFVDVPAMDPVDPHRARVCVADRQFHLREAPVSGRRSVGAGACVAGVGQVGRASERAWSIDHTQSCRGHVRQAQTQEKGATTHAAVPGALGRPPAASLARRSRRCASDRGAECRVARRAAASRRPGTAAP